MSSDFKRVNVLITEEQYKAVAKHRLNLSGLIRDLLHDRFTGSHITLALSGKVRALYDQVISNFGASDKDLEPYLVQALDKFLEDKAKEIQQVRSRLKGR